MERSTTGQPPTADRSEIGQRHTLAGADTDERDIPHFESLILPALVSVPPMPAWLRKFFRRTDTPAAR
jgi:hypothetical protein